MQIHSHKISITDSELEMIGDSLSAYIRDTLKPLPIKFDKEQQRGFVEEELDLLKELTNIGYQIYISGKDEDGLPDGWFTIDVNEFFEEEYKKSMIDKLGEEKV